MVIARASADAPKTFRGQTASYYQIAGFPTGQDTEYQEKEITIHTPDESTPIMYANPKITFVIDSSGVNAPGEQSYTRP